MFSLSMSWSAITSSTIPLMMATSPLPRVVFRSLNHCQQLLLCRLEDCSGYITMNPWSSMWYWRTSRAPVRSIGATSVSAAFRLSA